MKSANQTEIQKSFTQQAENFENGKMNFSKKEYLDYTVSKIAPAGTDNVLEVAAGTCACGRAVAPGARSVTCLDMTPAMLEVGRTEAEKAGLHNMHFVLGDAAEPSSGTRWKTRSGSFRSQNTPPPRECSSRPEMWQP